MVEKVIRQTRHLQGFRPEELADVVNGGRFEQFILSHSPCEVRHRRWALGTFSVDEGYYSFAVRAVGVMPRDRWCVGYVRPSPGHTTWINGFECGADGIQIYPAGSEVNYRAAMHSGWVVVEFDAAALLAAGRDRLGTDWDLTLRRAVHIPLPACRLRALDALVQRSFRAEGSAAQLREPILSLLAELIQHGQDGTLDLLVRRSRHREAILASAEVFLRQHTAAGFDSKALAAAVGATERSVQNHFLEAYGVTPGQWARCVALHRVRARLRQRESARYTLEAIATEYGFRHMGRFSGYYKELFGESPSETLTRGYAVPAALIS